MGKLIRLNTTFTGSNLPKLIDYDYSALEAEILAYPTLRAFYDAEHVTKSGANVTQLDDRSGNGYHFLQANTALAPIVSTINGVPSIYFDGTEEMKATGLFSGNNEQGVAAMIHAPAATGVSSIFLTDAATKGQNFYCNNTTIRALNAGVELAVGSVPSLLINYMCGFNIEDNEATLYGNGLSGTGTVGGMTAPTGDANLGRWADAETGNKYTGHIGYLAVFDEDLSKNAYLRRLLDRYARSRFRTSTWAA